jgi:hypothetical protein
MRYDFSGFIFLFSFFPRPGISIAWEFFAFFFLGGGRGGKSIIGRS